MTVERAKARRTAKGNIKLTITERQAKLLLSLMGPTCGSLSYSIYSPLVELTDNPNTFEDKLLGIGIFSDTIPE